MSLWDTRRLTVSCNDWILLTVDWAPRRRTAYPVLTLQIFYFALLIYLYIYKCYNSSGVGKIILEKYILMCTVLPLISISETERRLCHLETIGRKMLTKRLSLGYLLLTLKFSRRKDDYFLKKSQKRCEMTM